MVAIYINNNIPRVLTIGPIFTEAFHNAYMCTHSISMCKSSLLIKYDVVF